MTDDLGNILTKLRELAYDVGFATGVETSMEALLNNPSFDRHPFMPYKGDLDSDVAAWALERLTAARQLMAELKAKGES